MIYIWLLLVFVLGTVVGSGLGVCIGRIPYERSILWPSSRCDSCYQAIRWYDNIPIASYLLLGGKCRNCKVSFSSRHLWIEILTGLTFALFFYLDIILNVHDLPGITRRSFSISYGVIPLQFWLFWVTHALLASLLLVTSFCDIDHLEIPLSVTITGILFGLILSTFCPWPWPNQVTEVPPSALHELPPATGFHLWPVWYPLPEWLPPGSWKLGLITGLAGAFAGMIVLRGVRFLFGVGRGVEGLGLGDADLMMMVGSFIGWQGVVIAFFVSVFPALAIGLFRIVLLGSQSLAFGPSLALGSLLTLYCWKWLPEPLGALFFDGTLLLTLLVVGSLFLLLISFLLRVTGGKPQPVAPE